MSDFPTSAKVVVIGAGIVGNCLVGHLARLGYQTDLVLLDKGPLPNPGGSTGHASNFVFPVDHNKEMALLGEQSANQYRDLNLSVDSGGIEVARTQERMDELQRRMTSATAWGIEARLLDPAQVKELVPFINEDVILGGFYCPTVSVVDSLETGTVMRKETIEKAGCQVFANTEVLDILTDDTPRPNGRRKVTGVVTDKGTSTPSTSSSPAVWSNQIAYMADTYTRSSRPYQMADVGPLDVLAGANNEIGYPIVRDMDTFCYERQSAGSMEVGSYAHRPILHHPDEIPSNEEPHSARPRCPPPPTTSTSRWKAIELMDMLGDAEIKYAINGLLHSPPMPCRVSVSFPMSRTSGASAVWVKEGPGMAQVVAEWMTHGYPRPAPTAPTSPASTTRRATTSLAPRTLQQDLRHRSPRRAVGVASPPGRAPFKSRQEALGAEFFQARVWERPQWYTSNADLVERYGLEERPVEWDNRWWNPITVEHLNLARTAV